MIELRLATQKDLLSIKKLFLAGSKENLILNRSKSEIKALIKSKCFIVAVLDKEIIGMASLDYYSKRLSEIRSIYIKKGFRQNGVGKLVVNGVVSLAKKQGVNELMLVTTKETQLIFEKMGFTEDIHGFKVALFKKL